VRATIDEFCTLSFDGVDATQQMALTCRMLVALKLMRQMLSYWDEEGRQDVAAFKLLGLMEADMCAVDRVARKAGALVDQKRYREAYAELCYLRPWFLADSAAALDAQRASLRMELAAGRDESPHQRCAWADVVETAQCEDGQATLEFGEKEEPGLPKALVPQSRAPRSRLVPAAPAARQGRGGGGRETQGSKRLCRFEVGIEQDPEFQVCRRLIGPGGANMKRILANSGEVKIRIRGRGSKYLEGPEHAESTDPLMICISAAGSAALDRAAVQVEALLRGVHEDYQDFLRSRGSSLPVLAVRREVRRSR